MEIIKPLTLKELHDEFSKAWADDTEGLVKWEPGEEDEERTTGWRLLDTYIRQSASMVQTKPDAVEVSIEADLILMVCGLIFITRSFMEMRMRTQRRDPYNY